MDTPLGTPYLHGMMVTLLRLKLPKKLTNKGFIHLSNNQYRSLDEPSKTFIRQYNKQVRAGLSASTIPVPPGVTLIPSTPRLVTATPPTSSDPFVDPSPNTTPSNPKKRISFDIKPEEQDESS